nr:MAP7 domain-containing protein 1-like [Vicugna pacos]XP_031539055.1 MAP7 domain-containing protein 1-like [Vicugna pacos]
MDVFPDFPTQSEVVVSDRIDYEPAQKKSQQQKYKNNKATTKKINVLRSVPRKKTLRKISTTQASKANKGEPWVHWNGFCGLGRTNEGPPSSLLSPVHPPWRRVVRTTTARTFPPAPHPLTALPEGRVTALKFLSESPSRVCGEDSPQGSRVARSSDTRAGQTLPSSRLKNTPKAEGHSYSPPDRRPHCASLPDPRTQPDASPSLPRRSSEEIKICAGKKACLAPPRSVADWLAVRRMRAAALGPTPPGKKPARC